MAKFKNRKKIYSRRNYEAERKAGKNLVLFGGANIASYFINPGLVDEYRIVANPILLSRGNPLFKDIEKNTC